MQFLQKSLQRHWDAVSKLYVSPACSGGQGVGVPPTAGCMPGLLPASSDVGTKVPVLEALVPSLLVNSRSPAYPALRGRFGRRQMWPRGDNTQLSETLSACRRRMAEEPSSLSPEGLFVFLHLWLS